MAGVTGGSWLPVPLAGVEGPPELSPAGGADKAVVGGVPDVAGVAGVADAGVEGVAGVTGVAGTAGWPRDPLRPLFCPRGCRKALLPRPDLVMMEIVLCRSEYD
jgi:hypothetical protein